MNESCKFAEQRAGHYYLCEGGSETEIMYKHGFDFPHFAVFELLKNLKVVSALEAMYRSCFEVVAAPGKRIWIISREICELRIAS